MAVPAKKKSIAKKHIRHSARQTINIKRLVKTYKISACSHCGKARLAHRVCPHCGFYGGNQIVTIKTSSTSSTIEA